VVVGPKDFLAACLACEADNPVRVIARDSQTRLSTHQTALS
jgi:hypothetical protein